MWRSRTRHWLFGWLLLLATSVLATDDADTTTKQIAITFDQLPVAESFHDVDRRAVSWLLLDALGRWEVTASGFVVGRAIEADFDLLGDWLNAGHTLGSMTFNNQDYHTIDIANFLREIRQGAEAIEPMLTGFGQDDRWFRFPYLHYGVDPESRKQAQLFLESRNTQIAHATVIPDDYLYNFTLNKLGRQPDSSDAEQLMQEYLNHIFDELDAAHLQSKQLFGRSIPQVLLLRANRLNAIYLNDLLAALVDFNYEFVTLEYALSDPAFDSPDGYFGSEGVGWLERLANSDPDFLPAR